jgi:hypothetical protein
MSDDEEFYATFGYDMSDADSDNDSVNGENNDVIDSIYREDVEHAECTRTQHTYYIGICKLINRDYYLMVNSISNSFFFKYSYELCLQYLKTYSIVHVPNSTIEIMKLEIKNDCYNVDDVYTIVKKTHWIRLIQRHWKKVMKQRKAMYLRRGSIASLKHFETCGRYPANLNSIPRLAGMLRCYSTHIRKNSTCQTSLNREIG